MAGLIWNIATPAAGVLLTAGSEVPVLSILPGTNRRNILWQMRGGVINGNNTSAKQVVLRAWKGSGGTWPGNAVTGCEGQKGSLTIASTCKYGPPSVAPTLTEEIELYPVGAMQSGFQLLQSKPGSVSWDDGTALILTATVVAAETAWLFIATCKVEE